MLQRTPMTLVYLSAKDLGITARERSGLIEVRDDLASGRVKHAPSVIVGINRRDADSNFFNMRNFSTVHAFECCTVHCICGFMWARGVWDSYAMQSKALYRLFIPKSEGVGLYENLTPAQAVRAIDFFLTGAGEDCWPMALADGPA